MTITESGQLDLVDLLQSQLTAAEDTLETIEETLNPQIDANPDDKLLMEMLDYVTDADQSLQGLRSTLETMRHRDQEELNPPLSP